MMLLSPASRIGFTKPEFPDGGGDLRHLLDRVSAVIRVAANQPIYRPAFDLFLGLRTTRSLRLHRRSLNQGRISFVNSKVGRRWMRDGVHFGYPDNLQ